MNPYRSPLALLLAGLITSPVLASQPFGMAGAAPDREAAIRGRSASSISVAPVSGSSREVGPAIVKTGHIHGALGLSIPLAAAHPDWSLVKVLARSLQVVVGTRTYRALDGREYSFERMATYLLFSHELRQVWERRILARLSSTLHEDSDRFDETLDGVWSVQGEGRSTPEQRWAALEAFTAALRVDYGFGKTLGRRIPQLQVPWVLENRVELQGVLEGRYRGEWGLLVRQVLADTPGLRRQGPEA